MGKQTIKVRLVRATISAVMGISAAVFYMGATAPVRYHDWTTTVLTYGLGTLCVLMLIGMWANAVDSYYL